MYPPNSNVTGPYPKGMTTCNVIQHAQMLVVGGLLTNDTYMCDAAEVWGTHNLNLGLENKAEAIWHLYEPTLTTYVVPVPILTAIGGRNTGGALYTEPPFTGFDSPQLAGVFGRTASLTPRTPTRDITAPTGTSATAIRPMLNGGAIAGIVIGAIAVLAVLLVSTACLVVRRRRSRQEQEAVGNGAESTGVMLSMRPELADSQVAELYGQGSGGRQELQEATGNQSVEWSGR